ncbi:hypothetical protein QKW35_17455 [Pontibacterium granulatum]|uniref:PA3496 family putative envelope integrity protein n=1 Tax=Pontibacterium granulatum TaxID=2036029 RepID=UPI002499DE4D|nr:hypothetical protein [Pontibacterium granulatum]MDI3326170.1 hypothetical protein [Pontibacterium granulatum]
MLVRKEQDLNQIQTEVFDLLVGFDEEEKLSRKRVASRRSLRARRAIEQHFEEKKLHDEISERWYDE